VKTAGWGPAGFLAGGLGKALDLGELQTSCSFTGDGVLLQERLNIGSTNTHRSVAEFDYRQFLAGNQLIYKTEGDSAQLLAGFEFGQERLVLHGYEWNASRLNLISLVIAQLAGNLPAVVFKLLCALSAACVFLFVEAFLVPARPRQ
jgi:hypothetical protein